jgi:hypothetical protein
VLGHGLDYDVMSTGSVGAFVDATAELGHYLEFAVRVGAARAATTAASA